MTSVIVRPGWLRCPLPSGSQSTGKRASGEIRGRIDRLDFGAVTGQMGEMERDQVRLMAEYNAWMNEQLYTVCSKLSDEERKRDRGAFFKSIHGTLSHLLWADRAWLIRLLRWDLPIGNTDTVLFEDFDAMWEERKRFDRLFIEWARALTPEALAGTFELTSVAYKRTRRMPMYLLASHIWNHQTHHRGQLTTLLSQLGIDFGKTDLPWFPYADSICEVVTREGA